nr:MAG TPA: hypothetical protein [Caudoviricetes sp.]
MASKSTPPVFEVYSASINRQKSTIRVEVSA